MSKKVTDEELMKEFLEKKGMEEFEEFKKKKEEEAKNPIVVSVRVAADTLNGLFKKGNWTDQKVRRYIREGKLKVMNSSQVNISRNKKDGYQIWTKSLSDLIEFERRSKWDYKELTDTLNKDKEKLTNERNALQSEVYRLESKIKELEKALNEQKKEQ